MSHQHGKALYNSYDSEFSQLRRRKLDKLNDLTELNNLTKNNEPQQLEFEFINQTHQLNPAELKLKQNNQAFKNYMIGLCKGYIDNIGLREYDLSELEDLYNVLVNNSNLQGGDKFQRNYTYRCTETIPTEINLSWSVDNNNCVVLEYTNKTNNDIRSYKYLIGDNDSNGIIPEIMKYLNSVSLTFHIQDLNNFKFYWSFHFNYQVISLLNYYFNKDLDYFRQTKLILVLSTIYHHIRAFKNVTTQNNTVFNVITNALPFTCTDGAFLGDCALNSYLASTNPNVRKNIIEYFIKDYYNDSIGGQQMDDLITKIRNELDGLFNAVSSITFNEFINNFKSNLYSMLIEFRFNLYTAGEYKVRELSKLYVSILLLKAKINHLTNMIIRAPNINLNVLTEAFGHGYVNRNCVNRLIAEKYSDSNKQYLTLPVGLYKIPHAVLLVVERNDINGSSSNDKAYVVDLNDMSILFNNPVSEYKVSKSDSCLYILPNPSQQVINYKAASSITDSDSGITVDEIYITDTSNLQSSITISEWYQTYLNRCLSYLDTNIPMNKYHVNITKLFSCPIDDTFNVTQQIYNDLIDIVPMVLQRKGLVKTYLTDWSINTISMFSGCINKVIECLSQFYDNIPWEYIITGVNQLNYSYLFYVIDYILLMSKFKTYDNYSAYFVYQVSEYSSNLVSLKSIVTKLSAIDTALLDSNTFNNIKSKVIEVKRKIKDNDCLVTTIFELLFNELDKTCDKLFSSKDVTVYNKILSQVECNLRFINVMNQITYDKSIWLSQILSSAVVKLNVNLPVIDAYDILSYTYQLNTSVGLSFKPKYLELKDPVKSCKLYNKFKGGNGSIGLMTILQQLLAFLLVLVIVVVVIALIIKGVQLTHNNNE